MNADHTKNRSHTRFSDPRLSAFICVYLRLKNCFAVLRALYGHYSLDIGRSPSRAKSARSRSTSG
ncbi:MAG: hypothetical protein JSU71_13725, partial [Betaproteobacteria bacterium]